MDSLDKSVGGNHALDWLDKNQWLKHGLVHALVGPESAGGVALDWLDKNQLAELTHWSSDKNQLVELTIGLVGQESVGSIG